jgi:hypothetical protein
MLSTWRCALFGRVQQCSLTPGDGLCLMGRDIFFVSHMYLAALHARSSCLRYVGLKDMYSVAKAARLGWGVCGMGRQ